MSDQDLAIIDQALQQKSEPEKAPGGTSEEGEQNPAADSLQNPADQISQAQQVSQITPAGGSVLAGGRYASAIPQALGSLIERFPMPGSILFPLAILLIFFFLLLPINGHTRFVWLWLVLTGNASIGPGTGGGTQGTPAAPTGGGQQTFASLPLSGPTILWEGF